MYTTQNKEVFKMKEEPVYRPNVGLMIINKDGNIWLGRRKNSAQYQFNEQMPQGGIDKGETPLEAAYRELWEETGLKAEKVRLIAETQNWHAYDFPPNYRPFSKDGKEIYCGQRQKWFLFMHLGDDSDFNLTVFPEEIEFETFTWYPANKILERVVPFKRDVYKEVIAEFLPQIQAVCDR